MSTLIKVVTGPSGSGKLLPLDTPILTPEGWVLNRDLKIGDYVISQDGKPTKVLEVYDNESADIYNLEFSDGSSVECCNEHLWQVQTKKDITKKRYKVLTLEQMLDNINKDRKGANFYYSVPLCNAVEFNYKEVPINGHLLGWLLGDGYLPINKMICISTWKEDTEEIYNFLKKVVPENINITWQKPSPSSCNVSKISIQTTIKPLIKELGLLGLKSKEKFIPKQYLYNSIEVRKDILAGLLDTDGTVGIVNGTRKKCRFSTTSKQLQLDVVELVRGLGGYATYSETNRKEKGIEYLVNIRLPFNPFRLSRKKKLYDQVGWTYNWTKKIRSVAYIGKKAGRCIVVDNPSHLYIVKDYIVTHNSFKLKQEMTTNRLKLTASTGIASVNLSETACTIHSLLGAIDSSSLLKSYISGKLLKRLTSIFEDYNGIAIDEFGMLPRDYLDTLIKILDLYGQRINRNLELYLTGDIAQLPPVEFCGYTQ